MKKIGTVVFLGETCDVLIGKYQGNCRPAVTLVTASGEPMATATVNLPEHFVPWGFAAFKTWSENSGLLETLQEAGIVGKRVLTTIPTGMTEAPVCEILAAEPWV